MHEYFKAKVADLKKSLEENGANVGNISETNFFLMNWLINHIQKVDKELASYIKD